jgi:hypothetical protein
MTSLRPLSPSEFFGAEQRILAPFGDLCRSETDMQDEEWIRTLADGRKVKFIYLGLPDGGAFITAQLAGNEVVYSVILTKKGNAASREEVENHFKGELLRK